MKNNKYSTRHYQTRNSISLGWVTTLLMLTLFLQACTNNPVQNNNDDLNDLIASYRAQNKQMEARRLEALKKGIERLEITPPDITEGPIKISVDLKNARLDVVVKQILDGAKTEYINHNQNLSGTVTARFENRPLVEALTILLNQHGMKASRSGALIILEQDKSQDKLGKVIATLPDGAENVHIDWPLQNIDIKRATDVLGKIYPIDKHKGKRSINFASHTESNSIILSGSRSHVEEAIRLLDHIDEDSGHVLLEALVVEFNVDSFMDLGTRIESGASGELSNIFLDFANLAGNTISFTRVADAANTTSFSAMLNLLIEDEEARVVSRPYLSTVSGTEAHLEVAEDRFVVVQSPNGLNVTVQEISSGIILDILPVVTQDQIIMLDISINESQFVPTLGNIEQRRSRNTIKTSARVKDGETVIIGGLMLRTSAHSIAGIPGVRDIPIAKNLLNREEIVDKQTQVMIFITPHRWEPSLDLPLLNQDNWDIYETQPDNKNPD